MTQKQKELLLKDLCGRLPYGVILKTDNVFPQKLEGISFDKDTFLVWVSDGGFTLDWMGCCKPYLFPLSSMTDEQKEELYKMGWYLDEDKIYSSFRNYDDVNYKTHIDCFELVNWCDKNHFDINGLIPMGLANDATGLNIY